MEISVLGIDIAKNIFHLVGINEHGKIVYKKSAKRVELLDMVSNLPLRLVGMEACSGANYWAREMGKLGLEVKLLPARHVKAYLKGSKNDWTDAAAIAEAASRATMHFVSPKNLHQQDLQCLHRTRQRLIKSRTALCNSIRGFLAEYGIVIAKGKRILSKSLSLTIDKERAKLTDLMYAHIQELKSEMDTLEMKVDDIEAKLHSLCKENQKYKRLLDIDGVGPITASAIIATVGAATDFRNGRHFAAWLGLVPKQHSSGGKARLLGISKRGDSYLRSLLVQGARVSLMFVKGKEDARSRWAQELSQRRGKQKACVALANKNARTIWAMLAYGTEFNRQHAREHIALVAFITVRA